MSIRTALIGVAGLALGAAPALAHFDIYLSADTQVRTGGIELESMPATITPDIRVFGADLGEAPNPPGFGDEPGFYADALPANVGVGFDFLDALRVWDGTDFHTPASESLTLTKGLDSATTPATPGAFAPGLAFATSDSSGFVHDHMELALSSPGSIGVYLLTIQVSLDQQGIGASDPVYIVLNNGADEEIHDAAIAYVESTIPAPGAGALLGFAFATCSIRPRRRM